MLEIKHQIIGELPDPCPVPWIGNFLQCRYEVLDVFDDNFNLYSASSRVAACTYTIFLCTLYSLPDILATDMSIRS